MRAAGAELHRMRGVHSPHPVDFACGPPTAGGETTNNPETNMNSNSILLFSGVLALANFTVGCDSKQEDAREAAVERMADNLEERADKVRENAEAAADKVEDKADAMREGDTGEMTEASADAVEESADTIRDAAERRADAIEERADEVRDRE